MTFRNVSHFFYRQSLTTANRQQTTAITSSDETDSQFESDAFGLNAHKFR